MQLRILVLLGAVVGALSIAGVVSAAAPAPTVATRSSAYGVVLFDGHGKALYAFTRDPRGRSTCSGACAAAWPPYVVRGSLRAGVGTQTALLGTTTRTNGAR